MQKVLIFLVTVLYSTSAVSENKPPIKTTFPTMHSPAHIRILNPKLVLKFTGGDGGTIQIDGNQATFSPKGKYPTKVCGHWEMTLDNKKTGKITSWKSPKRCLPIKPGQLVIP